MGGGGAVGFLASAGVIECPYLKIAEIVSDRRYLQILQYFRRIGKTRNQLSGTRLIVAQVALGSTGGFAPFDDLIALTVKASNGDKCRHGPLLGEGSYRDQAQCDINFSPSPRLEHYPDFHASLLCTCSPDWQL